MYSTGAQKQEEDVLHHDLLNLRRTLRGWPYVILSNNDTARYSRGLGLAGLRKFVNRSCKDEVGLSMSFCVCRCALK